MLNARTIIRSEERRTTGAAFLTLFGIMAGHGLLETARDALFLTSLPATRLPWAYLLIAVVAFALSLVQSRNTLSDTGRQLTVFLAGSAIVSALFWLVTDGTRTWVLYALYVWTGVFATLAIVQFWVIVNDLFTITQAKRLFGVISTGGVLGAIVGAALARTLAEIWGARSLVAGSSVVFALSVVGPLALCRTARCEGVHLSSDAERAGPRVVVDGFGAIWAHPYLRRLALIVVTSAFALTAVDFLFKSLVARHIDPSRLAEVFASTYLVLNLLSLVAVLFLTGWITRTIGVSSASSLLPSGIVAGVTAVLLTGGIWAAFLLKGIDGALRYSLHRTGIELLYVPLAPELRARVKHLIDVIGQRGGQALASIAILLLAAMSEGIAPVAVVALLAAVAWLVLTRVLRSHYLDLFRRTLREGTTVTSLEFPDLDVASLETLITALNSSNDKEVHAALDLLADRGKANLVPALILYHPSPGIVRHAIDLFVESGREDYLSIADRLIGHLDPQVRAAILRARATVDPDAEMLYEYLGDPSPIVRATALAGLLSGDQEADDDTRGAIAEILDGESSDGRIALARAVATQEGPIIRDTLLSLARDEEPLVRLEAARAMRNNPVREFLPSLIAMLDRREMRNEAREVIAALGPDVIPELEAALADESLPPRVRLHIPRTIARIAPERAARVLLERIIEEPNGNIRYKILRVLGNLKASHTDLVFDRRAVRSGVERTLESIFRQMDWRSRLIDGAGQDPKRATPVHELLVLMLEHKENHAIDRLFRLLDLQHREENFRRIHRGLWSSDPKRRASSRELLENLLLTPVREAVIGIVDGSTRAERIAGAASFYASPGGGYAGVLTALLDEGGDALKSLVVFHVGELRLRELEPSLDGIVTNADDVLELTIQRARARLAEPVAKEGRT